MKTNSLKKFAQKIAMLTAPYDVPVDHAYSNQSIEARKEEYPLPEKTESSVSRADRPFMSTAPGFDGHAA